MLISLSTSVTDSFFAQFSKIQESTLLRPTPFCCHILQGGFQGSLFSVKITCINGLSLSVIQKLELGIAQNYHTTILQLASCIANKSQYLAPKLPWRFTEPFSSTSSAKCSLQSLVIPQKHCTRQLYSGLPVIFLGAYVILVWLFKLMQIFS